jgi:hypothetical protein
MPKVRIDDFEDDELLDEMPPKERILRRPKEERDALKQRTKKSRHNDEAAHRKEYSDE